jgi:hypothetical protein
LVPKGPGFNPDLSPARRTLCAFFPWQNGNTALSMATRSGNEHLVRLLLENKAGINVVPKPVRIESYQAMEHLGEGEGGGLYCLVNGGSLDKQ